MVTPRYVWLLCHVHKAWLLYFTYFLCIYCCSRMIKLCHVLSGSHAFSRVVTLRRECSVSAFFSRPLLFYMFHGIRWLTFTIDNALSRFVTLRFCYGISVSCYIWLPFTCWHAFSHIVTLRHSYPRFVTLWIEWSLSATFSHLVLFMIIKHTWSLFLKFRLVRPSTFA
jgi:hypothetical protein